MLRCTLEVAGSVVVVSRGGAPEAECALFDARDLELEAAAPGTAREKGYRTNATLALRRLDAAGIGAELPDTAAAIVRPALAKAYARGPAARSVVDLLEPHELFDASAYDVASSRYEGRWLDVEALARDLGGGNAGAVLQALHLRALLGHVAPDAVVWLAIGDRETEPRPGERSLRKVDLSRAADRVAAMRELRPNRPRGATDSGPSRVEVTAWLRAQRTTASAAQSRRLDAMAAALSARVAPTRGPLAETALWNLEVKLAAGEVDGLLEQIDALEKRRGRAPGTTYLRARFALETGTEDPKAIAERLGALHASMTGFHELDLLTARAWLAAGDVRRARAYARDLHENVSADEILRGQALDVLSSAGPGSIAAMPSVAPAALSRTPSSPRLGTPAPPVVSGGPPSSRPAQPAVRPGPPSATIPDTKRSSGSIRQLPPGTAFPPFRLETRVGAEGSGTWVPVAEIHRVETLAPPEGPADAPAPTEGAPRTPHVARLACTRLARELARDLRERHGVDLQDDVDGLEIAQRFLRETFVDGRVRTEADEHEVMRYGALLSELIARRLGGRWVDVEPADAGTWAMIVTSKSRPEEVLRIWPFGRVLRFLVMGHKERDLVSYYLELEARRK